MGIEQNPSIVTNGLIFYYDMLNRNKSWRGRKNLAKTSNGTIDWSIGNLTGVFSRTEVTTNEVYRISCTTTGSFRFSFNLSNLINGGTYTLSFKYRYINAAINDFILTDWNDTSITRNIFSLGEGIYFQSGTGTRSTYDSTYRFMDASMSAGQTIELWDFQLEQNTTYSPYVNKLLPNTEQLADLTNNNTITATSLTYASDGTFSFNGSSDYMTTTNTGITHGSNDWTYTLWANWSAITSLGTIYENGSWTSCLLLRFQNNGFAVYSMGTYWGFLSFTPILNRWYHLAFVRSGNTVFLYVDGTQITSTSFTATISPNTNLIYIGMSQHAAGQCFNGRLGAGSIYTRALTASEVAQNFSALRGRYNI